MDLWQVFVESVTREFAFLEDEFSLLRKTTAKPVVNYESDRLRVSIFYDSDRSHELDIGIRRLTDEPRNVPSIGLSELMQLVDKEAGLAYRLSYPANEMDLETEVRRQADLLRKYGDDLLRNKESVFAGVRDLNRQREREIRERNA
jgi:hypothetical protein